MCARITGDGFLFVALAIFDLDNTLLAGDSDHAWGEFLCRKGYVDAATYRAKNDRFYRDYCRGELDVYAYQRFSLSPLKGKSPQQLADWHREFMLSTVKQLWLPRAERLLQEHRQAGDFLLIVTATNRFVTAPIAEKLGVDDLIATEPELVDDCYTGEIVGMPSYQTGKVTRLQQWLEGSGQTMAGSSFYSDSHNDLPLLELVDIPVAVDPDQQLKRIAESRNWKIISLR
jgi:HAD superfamily hydrolase (TIGR01490 family)